jgi:hypothetical protein
MKEICIVEIMCIDEDFVTGLSELENNKIASHLTHFGYLKTFKKNKYDLLLLDGRDETYINFNVNVVLELESNPMAYAFSIRFMKAPDLQYFKKCILSEVLKFLQIESFSAEETYLWLLGHKFSHYAFLEDEYNNLKELTYIERKGM